LVQCGEVGIEEDFLAANDADERLDRLNSCEAPGGWPGIRHEEPDSTIS
jgi:hypothetical protein